MYKKVICLFSALVLTAVYSMPVIPEAVWAEEKPEKQGWGDEIDRMLKAGDYEEGSVVVCIDDQAGSENTSRGSFSLNSGDSKDLLAQAEEIMTVDRTAALKEVADDAADRGAGAKDPAAISLESAADEESTISVVRSSDMSTKEMLEILAEDDRVLFAEPNYITEIDTEADEKADSALRQAVKSAANEGAAADNADVDARAATEDKDADSRAADKDEDADPEQAEKPVAEPGTVEPAGDMTPQQWSSSETADYHAARKTGEVSMNVPGFGPDGSDMEGDPIVVAVNDFPVDFSNPDLADAAYTFTEEEQELLGCDEHGYNATWQSKDGKLEYYPGKEHGTHCAGIIGASWDGHGISGVASNVRIISLQNSVEDGKTSLINALRCFSFIKRANELTGADIRITSNSWGLVQFCRTLDAAITDLGESQGVISIFAAANDTADMPQIREIVNPLADNPYVILVASTTAGGNISEFSNYSDEIVDLGAPGSGILSCSLTGEDELNYFPDAVKDTNKLYEGFETETPKVDIDFVDEQGNKAGACSVSGTDGMVFAGQHALCLDVSKATPIESYPYFGFDVYLLQLKLGDLKTMGVKAGDTIGFCIGADETTEILGLKYINVQGEEKKEDDPYIGNSGQSFELYNAAIPEDMDLSSAVIQTTIYIPDGVKYVWIDSVGVGNDKVPYAFLSGTSMACPAVSGAAAVLASRSGARGSDLADVVRASVRPMEALSDTRTGGIIDLSVDVDQAAERGPAIDSMKYQGRTVTLTGRGFGDVKGTVALTKEVVGAKPIPLDAKVASWTDSSVKLVLGDDAKGIVKAVLTTAVSGKKDTIIEMISLSDNIFRKDFPLSTETGDPYLFDAPGDMESSGILMAVGKELYYLPEKTIVERTPAYRSMYSFDTETQEWSEKAPLPEWMEYASAAVVSGTLYVKGSLMDVDETGEIPTSMEEPQAAVYAYDPDKDEWKEASAVDVSTAATLVGDGKSMYLVGESNIHEEDINFDDENYEYPEERGLVRVYDPEKGAGDEAGTISMPLAHPAAVIRKGIVYVYDIDYYWLESVRVGPDPEYADIHGSLPEIYEADAGFSYDVKKTLLEVVLLDAGDGILMVGPPAADGSSDTWFLEDGTEKFVPAPKRMSDSKVTGLAAAVYDGSVYVIGSSPFEAGDRFFRTDTLANILPKTAPEKTSIEKLVKGKKSFTVKWIKRSAPVKGYQVRYSLKKDFSKATVKTVTGASKTSLKVKKLKKNKKYYVQVRTYKTIAGKKIYSAWSRAKSVRTK